jgi:hypothetical protein
MRCPTAEGSCQCCSGKAAEPLLEVQGARTTEALRTADDAATQREVADLGAMVKLGDEEW